MNRKIGVFCASSDKMDPVYYSQARQLGAWIGRQKLTLVYGGSRCGLMEAVAQATHDNGGTVFGVVPRKVEQNDMASDQIDITFHCEDLNDRKQWLIGESDIMIVLPGSVGTLDEAFSAMASNTFGMHGKKVVFWNINGFYDLLFQFLDTLQPQGVLNKPWDQVALRAQTLDDIIRIIENQ